MGVGVVVDAVVKPTGAPGDGAIERRDQVDADVGIVRLVHDHCRRRVQRHHVTQAVAGAGALHEDSRLLILVLVYGVGIPVDPSWPLMRHFGSRTDACNLLRFQH